MNRAIPAAAFASALVLLVAGCAAAGKEPRRANPSTSSEECLYSTFVEDWAPVDKETFILYGPGRHDAFLGRLAYPTSDLTLSHGMSVVDDDGNGRICGQSMDSVTFPDPTMPGKIFISSLKKITEAEAKALIEESRKPK